MVIYGLLASWTLFSIYYTIFLELKKFENAIVDFSRALKLNAKSSDIFRFNFTFKLTKKLHLSLNHLIFFQTSPLNYCLMNQDDSI